jgi:transposase InsO family protein
VLTAWTLWLAKVATGTPYIDPGSPWENGYCESFNRKLRDECLNGEIFLLTEGGPNRDRELARGIQHEAAVPCTRLQAVCNRGL